MPARRKNATGSRKPTRPSSFLSIVRAVSLAGSFGYFAQKHFRSQLLPHGSAVPIPMDQRGSYASIDMANDSLQGRHGKLTKIYERLEEGKEPLLKGPETVVINGKDGSIFALTEEALLVSLTKLKVQESIENKPKIMTAQVKSVADLGMGRPLGGRFTPDGRTLYIADALLGLIKIDNPHKFPKSKVEIVANKVMDGDKMTRILYCNDVVVGPKTGKVYFTDSSDVTPDRIGTRTWDTMYAYKTDLIRGKRSGRLLEYDPSTEEVKVLARGLWFPNGVGVDKDETYIFLAETSTLQLLKFRLVGPDADTLETAVESQNMTGYPDGADCNWKGNRKCYSVMPSCIVPLSKIIRKLPHPIDLILRNIYLMLPKALAPKVKPYGGIIEVDPDSKEINYFQDPDATDIGHLAGVTVWDNKLYLGSLKNNFIGVYDLK